jgi:hypothetical protein
VLTIIIPGIQLFPPYPTRWLTRKSTWYLLQPTRKPLNRHALLDLSCSCIRPLLVALYQQSLFLLTSRSFRKPLASLLYRIVRNTCRAEPSLIPRISIGTAPSNKFKSIELREERIHGVSPPEFITASALATSLLPRPSALDSFRPPSVLQVLDLPSFTTAQSIDERPSLPSIGHDISRPSSTSTQSSSVHPYSLQRHGSSSSLQLPGLSALASIASSSPAASNSPNNSHNNNNTPNR